MPSARLRPTSFASARQRHGVLVQRVRGQEHPVWQAEQAQVVEQGRHFHRIAIGNRQIHLDGPRRTAQRNPERVAGKTASGIARPCTSCWQSPVGPRQGILDRRVRLAGAADAGVPGRSNSPRSARNSRIVAKAGSEGRRSRHRSRVQFAKTNQPSTIISWTWVKLGRLRVAQSSLRRQGICVTILGRVPSQVSAKETLVHKTTLNAG